MITSKSQLAGPAPSCAHDGNRLCLSSASAAWEKPPPVRGGLQPHPCCRCAGGFWPHSATSRASVPTAASTWPTTSGYEGGRVVLSSGGAMWSSPRCSFQCRLSSGWKSTPWKPVSTVRLRTLGPIKDHHSMKDDLSSRMFQNHSHARPKCFHSV